VKKTKAETQFRRRRGVEQWSARQAHNLEVVGSSPTPATTGHLMLRVSCLQFIVFTPPSAFMPLSPSRYAGRGPRIKYKNPSKGLAQESVSSTSTPLRGEVDANGSRSLFGTAVTNKRRLQFAINRGRVAQQVRARDS
jgi:hypothetical protein